MQTAMPMPSSKVRLKLFIRKSNNRALFVEAGKDFVDFFDNILHLPVGTLITILKPEIMLGCFGKIQDSIINLSPAVDRKFDDTKCPSCGSRRRFELKYSPLNGVKEAPYLVMNDLEVKTPAHSLYNHSVKQVSSQERRGS